jgi:hypothetical protein
MPVNRHEIVVRRGKGQKDRRTVLPVATEPRLQEHLERVKRQHQRDLADGFGCVVLPFALDRKYPHAAQEWGWLFVFPAARICRDPRWGPPSRSGGPDRGASVPIEPQGAYEPWDGKTRQWYQPCRA